MALQTLDKIVSIIELLESHDQMKLQEIADSLDMNKSTAYRFLGKLTKYGFLRKNQDNKKYELGFRFLNISSYILDRLDIAIEAKESLDKFSEVTGETIYLAVLSGNQIIYISKRESSGPIRTQPSVGSRADVYATGSGKVMLAFMDSEKRNKILDSIKFIKHTERTITTKSELLAKLDYIKKTGYALNIGEFKSHFLCLAAPVMNHNQDVVAALSISIFIMSEDEIDGNVNKYKDILLGEAKNISRNLGYKEGF